MESNCIICGGLNEGAYVITGGGSAHRWCYWQANPPRIVETIFNVIHPRAAAEVVQSVVPPELVTIILDEYNGRMKRDWLVRCKEPVE